MLRDDPPGFVVECVGVPLNLLREIIRVNGRPYDLEVLHELQRDGIGIHIQPASSAITDRQLDSENRLDAMADDLHLARIHRHDDADISRPQPVAILAILAGGKRAAGLSFAPAHRGRTRLVVRLEGTGGSWRAKYIGR